MDRKWTLAAAAVAALFVSPLQAQDNPAKADDGMPAALTQDELNKIDQGPDTIDVSQYPKEQQANYELFAAKCSRCHTLARPINAPFALPQEWKAYVTKMSHKPRSGIDEDSAKKIIDFLTYDSSVRKKDLIEAKLKAQKPAQAAPAKADQSAAKSGSDAPAKAQ